MKKSIGYIFCQKKPEKEDLLFQKIAKNKNIELVMINICNDFNEEALEELIKKCDIIYNNSAEEFAIELVKTIEELAKKVLSSSK